MKSNENLIGLIRELKKKSIDEKANIWKSIALHLESPKQNRKTVNLYKIDKFSNGKEIIVVPGKVLGTGDVTKKINVYAFKFSQSALEKINKNGKAGHIIDLIKDKTKPSQIRIIV